MSAEANQGLVRLTFRDIDPSFGKFMDDLIGVENSGFIPVDDLEILHKLAEENGVNLEEMGVDKPHDGEISRLFRARPRDSKISIGRETVLIAVIGELMWVSNADLDDFRRLFGYQVEREGTVG